MNFCRHVPAPPLSAFVEWFWYYDDLSTDHSREHVLPDGTFELVINLAGPPRRLFAQENVQSYRSFKRAWLSGAQSGYLVIDVINKSSMMGVHFRPGGIAAFAGFPSHELKDQVVELDHIWGIEAWDWHEQLQAARGPAAKFAVLEAWLLERLRGTPPTDARARRVAHAIREFEREAEFPDIRATARSLNISHKHLIEEFRRVTGLTPKLYCRIQRFQRVLASINTRKQIEWAAVAVSCGYFDQAHFIHDFTAFSGVNPSAYLRHRTGYPGFIRASGEG